MAGAAAPFLIWQAPATSFKVSAGSIGDKALYFPKETVREERFGAFSQHAALVEKFSSLTMQGGAPEEFWPVT